MDADFFRKLGIKDGHRVRVIGAPPEFRRELGAHLPPSCVAGNSLREGERVDVIILWADEPTERRFPELQRRLQPDGALWVVIPKKPYAQRTGSPVTFDGVQAASLATSDLVDNKTLTFSDTHYGIRFVIRKEKRRAR
ncbi:MAG TPA: hypothetical protein VFT91_09710 [Dehalococcoidia bacterium]|nr:hypothetical protein [Dehalococcoidia bacterium]